MRTFHIFILAYALTMLGCGYKTMPYWKTDTPKETSSEQKAQPNAQQPQEGK